MPETEKRKSQRWVLPAVAFLTAISLGVGFGPDLIQHFREKKIMDTGVQALAMIVDLHDTGNRSNSNPEVELTLEVRPDDGKPFPAVATRVLTPVALQRYRPGATVLVKYDPEDPGTAIIIGLKSEAPQ